jgi:hypothetical protein
MTVTVLNEDGSLSVIEAVELKIGPLYKRYDHPTNPFTVNIMREESIKLNVKNSCYACIWYYTPVNGVNTLVKKTCEGTLTIETKPEIIGNGRCSC